MKNPVAFLLCTVLWVLVGCHADPDDPAGQAKELADPVRREHALANIHRLYTGALAKHNGDRAAAEVKTIADATIDKLVETYVNNPEDTQNGQVILDVLYEMRDPRSLPALLKALDWREEVTDEHAYRAAKVLRTFPI